MSKAEGAHATFRFGQQDKDLNGCHISDWSAKAASASTNKDAVRNPI
jgi:hypothetical protein